MLLFVKICLLLFLFICWNFSYAAMHLPGPSLQNPNRHSCRNCLITTINFSWNQIIFQFANFENSSKYVSHRFMVCNFRYLYNKESCLIFMAGVQAAPGHGKPRKTRKTKKVWFGRGNWAISACYVT